MQVTLYTTSTCQYSSAEKQYLDSLGTTYSTVVLDQDKSKLPEFIAASGGFSGVPVTVVVDDGGKTTVVKGFDQEKLNDLLGKPPAQSSISDTPPATTAPAASLTEPSLSAYETLPAVDMPIATPPVPREAQGQTTPASSR